MTKKLRKAPPLKIEKARAQMALVYVQSRILSLPNHVVLMNSFQNEFDAFMSELHNYYDIKRQLLESKKNLAFKKYERS
ncbi:hypothetical protein ACJBVY_12110, partial [Streptococcus suis]